MSNTTPTGRHAIKAAAAQVDLDRDATPASDAIAHVLCRMGGHIPNIDNEQPGACDFHRRHAVVAAAAADRFDHPGGSRALARRARDKAAGMEAALRLLDNPDQPPRLNDILTITGTVRTVETLHPPGHYRITLDVDLTPERGETRPGTVPPGATYHGETRATECGEIPPNVGGPVPCCLEPGHAGEHLSTSGCAGGEIRWLS